MLNKLEERERRRDPSFALKRGEICPGDTAAVVALNRQRKASIFAMRWGFSSQKKLIINARSETASARPMFRESMKLRRCLIPASAYFEWDHREKKHTKYRFRPVDQPVTYLAGLYRFEEGGPVFTILTREAAESIACFHDRMPVIARPEQLGLWLDQSAPPSLLLDDPVTSISWLAEKDIT